MPLPQQTPAGANVPESTLLLPWAICLYKRVVHGAPTPAPLPFGEALVCCEELLKAARRDPVGRPPVLSYAAVPQTGPILADPIIMSPPPGTFGCQ